jgi:RNA polymerase sigma factor (sigma-70 family)
MLGGVNELLEPHRALLFAVAYRITGSAADAEDIVQEAFVRALLHPPPDLERSLRPWLVRVAANLARDQLRARKRRDYAGSWLPAPCEVRAPADTVERREEVGWATLVALEALTPQQRTVLVLRDVAELPADDVADWLGTNAQAVRATHSRARRALAEATPPEPADLDGAMLAAIQRLSMAILAGDLDGLKAVLADDVRLVNDSAGVYRSAMRVVVGAERVARFLLGVNRKTGPMAAALVRVNDRWAVRTAPERLRKRLAPRGLTMLTLALDGRIAQVSIVVAPDKLVAVG